MATTVLNSHPKPRAPAPPTDVLPTDTAQLYTHVHPILVLSLYALQFPSIVADPVPALATALVPLAILQIVYVAICLPPTGGTATPVVDKKKVGGVGGGSGEKGKKGGVRGTIIVRLVPFPRAGSEKKKRGYEPIIGLPKLTRVCTTAKHPLPHRRLHRHRPAPRRHPRPLRRAPNHAPRADAPRRRAHLLPLHDPTRLRPRR